MASLSYSSSGDHLTGHISHCRKSEWFWKGVGGEVTEPGKWTKISPKSTRSESEGKEEKEGVLEKLGRRPQGGLGTALLHLTSLGHEMPFRKLGASTENSHTLELSTLLQKGCSGPSFAFTIPLDRRCLAFV